MLKNLVKQLLTASRAGRRSAPESQETGRMELIRRGLGAESAGDYNIARAAYHEILHLNPDDADALHLLGRTLMLQDRCDEAVVYLRRSAAVAPHAPEACYTLGEALRKESRFEGAAEAFREALTREPALTAAWVACGDMLTVLGRVDEAETCYREALAREPAMASAYHNYGNLLHCTGRMTEAVAAYRRAVELQPDFARAHSNLVYALNFLPDLEPDRVYAEHLEWAQRHAAPLQGEIRAHATARVAGRRLKVGYVSPNFREHAVAQFFEPTLRHHDRNAFSIYLYSDVRAPDARTARLRSYGDIWRETAGLSDAVVAERVRSDGIDILVDLTGHTDGHRLLVFARKPAPVQVTWNGYANTTGMDVMDYRLTDGYADPVGVTDRWHAERLVRLPEIYMTFDPPESSPNVGPAPVCDRGYVTFGVFNAFAKVTPRVVAVWARILHAVPDARLLMLTIPDGRTRSDVVRAFAGCGVPEHRLQLRGRLPFPAFLEAHRDADLALDPFPFSGTTTTCQSLWMGLPVITLSGRTHASRVGVSLLENIGLPEFIARDESHYVELAVALARDVPRLQALRAGMRERMLAAPITNGARLTRFLESAYRRMWEDYCRGA